METDNFSAALAFPRGIIVGRLLQRRPYRFSFFAHSLAAAHGTGHTGVVSRFQGRDGQHRFGNGGGKNERSHSGGKAESSYYRIES